MAHREFQLRGKQLDFLFIYPKDSETAADEVIRKLTDVGLTGRKYDEFEPFKDFFLNHKDEVRIDLGKRSTFLLFHVDNNLSRDKEMILYKNEKIEEEIFWPKENVIPIWYVSKGKLNKEAFDSLYGLRSINGISPHREDFGKVMKELAGNKQFATAKQKREEEQEKKLDEYLRKEREEIQKKMEEMKVTVEAAQEIGDDGDTSVATGTDQRMEAAQATGDDGDTSGATGTDQRMPIAQATDDDDETLNKETSEASEIDQRKDDADDEGASN